MVGEIDTNEMVSEWDQSNVFFWFVIFKYFEIKWTQKYLMQKKSRLQMAKVRKNTVRIFAVTLLANQWLQF